MARISEIFKKYFIPHEGNDYRPHFLRPRMAIIILAWIFVAEFFVLLQAFVIFPRSKMLGTIFPATIVDFTNSDRISNNQSSLTVNPLLQEAAQEKANDMAQNSYFAHTSPSGLTPWYWFIKAGYGFSSAGENLAVNFSDSKDVMDAWMNSPEHRANILNGTFTEIGVATAVGTYEGSQVVFVVQEFGTPAVVPVAPIAFAAPKASSHQSIASIKPSAPKEVIRPLFIATNISSTGVFAEVKGVSMNNHSSSTSLMASSVPKTADESVAVPAIHEANAFQTLLVTPHVVFDYVLMVLCTILLFALALNIFIKIRIQHPILIANGLSLIVIIGVFITANQDFFGALGKIL